MLGTMGPYTHSKWTYYAAKITQDLGNFVLDQFLVSIHNLISAKYLLKCLAFLFKTLYLQSQNTLCQEDHQVKLAELGWTPEERFGAHGEYPPGILRPTSEFVCLDM